MNRRLAIALATLAAAGPATAATPPSPSLCTAAETPLFSCPIGTRLASVCALPGGGAAYRFGRPGHVELQSRDLTVADQGFSGGGETQVSFQRGGYSYLIYSKTVRTGFGPDGHNDPQSTSGLLVRKDGRTVSSRRCGGSGDQPIDSQASKVIAPGAYIPH